MVFLPNFKLTIAYDGTNFAGFQKQKNTPQTIQGILEEKLHKILKEPVKVIGAGRTDAGVHALGQVVNFSAPWKAPVDKIPEILNNTLPTAIRVLEAEIVPDDFHARYSARKKEYRYYLYYGPPSPFYERYAWALPQKLDREKVAEALEYLIGTHDFSGFGAAGSSGKNPIKTMFEASYREDGFLGYFTFVADSFLYKMARILTGTLVEIGLNGHPERVREILTTGNKKLAGKTAPAHGLFLVKVFY
ncbi:tRNA pseudouridine(38-40) synthase TruA [Carboxydothermus ferrireducens]|uniref:tRNA pseudouridine synthase A n=1 Tax=Carboxydothermus ferrireducens DSM 11255 TaxID=1119529 RepID=A0ABX2R9W9_9THEO|nr:tRNA pseudouridine(38-40) synthase TruA [Carboxydothermus ferrireducens]NYE57974.1 tRNA pseudouridine38-40 synthase [Carboxydothermus ferrireducens DSM 11255]